MEIALALAAALALGWWLGRRRGRRRAPAEELDLEEGALDPDELEGEPLYWDEGADDEVD